MPSRGIKSKESRDFILQAQIDAALNAPIQEVVASNAAALAASRPRSTAAREAATAASLTVQDRAFEDSLQDNKWLAAHLRDQNTNVQAPGGLRWSDCRQGRLW